MQKPKPLHIQAFKKPVAVNRLEFITDVSVKLAIPVGPRFQADVPDWIGHIGDSELNTSRWLGTRTWPVKGSCLETNCNAIGRGRPDFCSCITPGSIECVRRHVTDKRSELQRIGLQTRSSYAEVNTDEDEIAEAPYSKGSRKRCRVDSVTSISSKCVKGYLTGR
ncbi:unnamed protein product [Ilex paraguariensis]|uniref:ELM2 domain-containing protein n=1 Tax=Ilex paraguariensis TaxID=185542 RepID=A0ABC8T9T3_9AQUA